MVVADLSAMANAGADRRKAGGVEPPPHPNDLDRRRLARALVRRHRYRYVTPRVLREGDSLRVTSPNCSRNIDADGGVIDIALLRYAAGERLWRLHYRDHAAARWCCGRESNDLDALLEELIRDPQRCYWP